MSYKSLVTVVRRTGPDTDCLTTTAALCEAWDAHLDVLALGTDRLQPGAFYAGAAAVSIQASMEDAIEEAKVAEVAARSILDGQLFGWSTTAAVAQIGAISQLVARHAGLSDLVVLPVPYGEQRNVEDVAVLEAALFSTRTPLLVLPENAPMSPRPERVVVGWNQSSEALTAIRAAMPILKTAKVVDITIIDPPEHDPERSDPGGQLAEMLSRHGVAAEISVLARTMPRISDVVLRHVSETGADLVVMGAYGHSRFREAILGGATRNMLADATTPVLMAH